jgi:tRNA-dihydrouridine synthase A
MSHLLCVAPMLDWTDRHCRYFFRLLAKNARLYSEMVTTQAILHGDRKRLLGFNLEEHPIALQLGGSCPRALAECSVIGEDFGYDEINLNIGCPSDRVQQGRFGACLMAEPELVADCVASMSAKVSIPVTIKTRIGIDNRDSYQELFEFVQCVASAGCQIFIIHARKAWLKGLSPKENREVPPLCYETVYHLKRDFPDLTIVINGGITTMPVAQQQLAWLDGVMIGREAYHNPYFLATLESAFFPSSLEPSSRSAVLDAFINYAEFQLNQGVYLNSMTRHILGLFQGLPGARAWRRYLSQHACKSGAGSEIIQRAAEAVV